MKLELESADIEAIAKRVAELVKPALTRSETSKIDDGIFTTQTLAAYLKVDVSWVYKRVSAGTIPFFKHGKFTRFRKSAIIAWLETHSQKPQP